MAAEVVQPLRGRTVLVTRPGDQARELCRALEALGARVEAVPVIRLLPPEDLRPLLQAAAAVDAYDWVVFTSRNGVHRFGQALAARHRRLPARARVACIGPATARAAAELGWTVHLQPAQFVAESLVDAFRAVGVRGARVLVVRAQEARDVLPQGLEELGARVEVVAAYRTEPAYNEAERLRGVLRQGVDLATFASPSAVHAAVRLCGGPELLRRVPAVCIGPVTASAAQQAGLWVAGVADTYTQEGLVDAVVRAARGEGSV
ncbi:MAG: uroporphyrinogen-III synthase [Armatimonadota bacterium]|nr:uroporphyrinogen-III synthase [Armatimonadota bacterium]MDW8157153.1 uroporphyrinogen-III synthase [Armatimonadota bacterium]